MLALKLSDDLVKGFMGRLMKEGIFNDFKVRNVDVLAKNRFSFDGEVTDGETKDFSMWSDVQPLIFEIIKQMGRPRLLKIVFSHKEPQDIHQNASALFLNLMYDSGKVSFTTATSQKAFSLEKTLDSTWNEWMRCFFSSNGIVVSDRE